MTNRIFSLSVLACLFAVNAAAQTNPWNGNWKADPASLKFSGATMTITPNADGYTVSSADGTQLNKVRCDGKPEADAGTGMMRTCTKTADGYVLKLTRDGQLRQTVTLSSTDGQTATRVAQFTPAQGEPYTITAKLQRSGAPGKGLAGTWKEVGFSESQDTGILSIKVDGDNIAFKETDAPSPIDLKLDGTAVPQGPGTMSAQLADPHTLKITYKDAKGTVRRENTFVLSADGTTITETDVTPSPMPSTMELTLHKS